MVYLPILYFPVPFIYSIGTYFYNFVLEKVLELSVVIFGL